jgi:16S rRNA processing protein RimM
VTAYGDDVGEVTDVLHLPDQDLLVIGRGGAEVLVPFVTAIVPEVDLSAGRVVIDPPRGLLDPTEADEAAP